MASGVEYWADSYLKDAGTLQGKVSEVTSTLPNGTPSALLQDMTVTVQELTGSDNGQTWTNLTRVGGNTIDGSHFGAGSYAAPGSYTFSMAVNN
jgi:hypothetical protein